MSVFHKVDEFHKKFGLHEVTPAVPQLYESAEMAEFRTTFLAEESEEFGEALYRGELVKAVDANLDAIYVAAGNLLLLGIPADVCEQLYAIVHDRNMAKERATGGEDGRSTRKSQFDVVKPEGWYPPEELIASVLVGLGGKP